MVAQALPLILLAEALGMSIPIVTEYYKTKGIDLSGYDANDIVPLEVLFPEQAELNRIKKYKTWDESFIKPESVIADTDLSGIAVKMSESEARAKGYIIPPDPTITDEERKKNLTLPNIPPDIDIPTHTGDTGGQQVELPQHTGGELPDMDFPTHTGDTSPPYVPTLDDYILRSEIDEGEITQDEKKPPFYSKVKKVIEDARMDKATTDQWKGYIDNAGVNQAELDWIGLNDYLADKKSVTKEEVLNFVTMNDLAWQVKDIILGTESDALKFTGDTMEMIEGQGTTLTHDPRVPEILREAHGYQDAKDIVMNEEGLYNQYQEYLQETDQVRGDEIEGLESFLKDEFGIVKGSSEQGKTMFNRGSLITEGDYTDYKEMIFQLPKNEWLMRDLENQIKDLQKEKNLLAETRSETGAIKDEKKWHELSDRQDKLQDKIDQIQASNFKSHYKYPNVFAHARFNTREIDGKKTLFIEELQSDWIHRGKKHGFIEGQTELQKKHQEIIKKLDDFGNKLEGLSAEHIVRSPVVQEDTKKYNKLQDELKEVSAQLDIENEATAQKAPNIPFKKNWQDLVLKRLIRYAAENDFDAIALAGGNIQTDRYDLSKQVNEIIAQKYDDGIHLKVYDKNDSKVIDIMKLSIQEVERYVGKELAEKIKLDIEKNPASQSRYSGLDLKVGGEGLKSMYDEIFSKSLKKIGKKFDAKLIEKVMKSKKFTADEAKDIADIVGDNFTIDDEGWYKQKENEFWFMDITSSMKKQALEAGFPITGLREGGIVEIPHFYYGGFVDVNRL